MPIPQPKLLGFAAFSGTGKTTLIEQLLPLLNQSGYAVGVIKHSHHDFEIDYPGKDSHRLRSSGANPTLLVSPYRQVRITEYPHSQAIDLHEQVAALTATGLPLALIVVEGFRDQPIDKIELHRPSLGKPLLFPDDPHVIALASDSPLTTVTDLPLLDLNQPEQIAEFIIKQFLESSA